MVSLGWGGNRSVGGNLTLVAHPLNGGEKEADVSFEGKGRMKEEKQAWETAARGKVEVRTFWEDRLYSLLRK